MRTIEIKEEVKIEQGDHYILLEKGDRIEIQSLKEEDSQFVTIDDMVTEVDERAKEIAFTYWGKRGQPFVYQNQVYQKVNFAARWSGALQVGFVGLDNVMFSLDNIVSIERTVLLKTIIFKITYKDSFSLHLSYQG